MNAQKLHLLAVAAAIAASLAMASAPTFAAGATAGHDHQAAAPAKLSLDNGHKWGTDEALRSGMQRIRAAVEPQLAAAHGGKLSPADYAALAGKVENEIAAIVGNCKLEPKADAMLHLVIADLGAGADAMAGKAKSAKPEQGLVKVAGAVNNYGRYFDHPGFKPIRLDH